MAERKYITDENLKRFGSNVKKAINDSKSDLTTEIGKAKEAAQAAASAAAGALKEAQAKIPKGALATINGQSLENGGNIELDFTVAEFVTKLPEVSTASKSKIYLVASSESGTQNTYAEYIKITVGGTDKWEKLGEYKAEMDLTPYAKAADLKAHTGNKENPHGVTKAQVGLGNVDNTSDSTKANTAGNPIHDAIAKKVNNDHIATTTSLGLIKAGTTSGKTYGVNVDASTGAATVSVPWTDQNVYQAVVPAADANAYPILGSAEKSLADGKAAQSVYLKGLTFTPKGSVLSVGTGTMTAARFQGKADTAGSADSATKATQDGGGNIIVSTYQTKTDFNAFKNEFVDLTNTEIDNLWATAPDTLS